MIHEELKICNLDYLFELAKGDMGFVKEMIGVFITDTPEEILSLKKCIENENFEDIKQVSHKLRSSVPYVGLDRMIGDELMEIEEFASNHKSINEIKNLFLKVNDICQKAFKELENIEL
jgi:HPt (histidine-containing phosphotransfer) domain-containing protein